MMKDTLVWFTAPKISEQRPTGVVYGAQNPYTRCGLRLAPLRVQFYFPRDLEHDISLVLVCEILPVDRYVNAVISH